MSISVTSATPFAEIGLSRTAYLRGQYPHQTQDEAMS